MAVFSGTPGPSGGLVRAGRLTAAWGGGSGFTVRLVAGGGHRARSWHLQDPWGVDSCLDLGWGVEAE